MSDADEKIATTNYRSGKLSPADAGHLAWEILETYGVQDDRTLHVYLAARLREVQVPGGTALAIWAELNELLALQLFFSPPVDPDEAKSASALLFLISFSKRAPDEADDLASFDFHTCSWWRKLSSDLQAYSDEWAAEIARDEALLIENGNPESVDRNGAE